MVRFRISVWFEISVAFIYELGYKERITHFNKKKEYSFGGVN